MKTIRPSVFETNSSSVHTLCLCSEADYDKFTNKELFWKYENLVTLDEAYEEFCKYLAEHADDGDYSLHSFDDKVPSKELFEKAIKEEEWTRPYNRDHRSDFKNDEQWYIANIQWWLSDADYGNNENYFLRYGDWYETYWKKKDGMIAFGYFGRDG